MAKQKFYRTKWFLWLSLIVFPPIGLILLWAFHKQMKKVTKILLSVIFALWFVILLPFGNGPGSTFKEAFGEGYQAAAHIEPSPTEESARNTPQTGVAPADKPTQPPIHDAAQAIQPEHDSVQEVAVHFIDVGQGDSILIESNNAFMLVDAGENDKGAKVVSYLRKQGVRELEYVVATHPHSDHIGGLDTVLNEFKVNGIIMTKVEHTTKTFEDLLDAIIENDVPAIEAKAGNTYKLGAASFEILAAGSSDDLNNLSVVLKLTLGDTSFLLTGDAEAEAEAILLRSGYDLQSTVLKVGHHGSSTSTSDAFLKEVKPKYAVICVGKDNSYRHPHPETIEKLVKQKVEIYRTDELGAIIASSDGKTVTFYVQPVSGTFTQIPAKAGTPSPAQKGATPKPAEPPKAPGGSYIGNINSHKFHKPDCDNLPYEENRVYFSSREEAVKRGYEPCKNCNP